ncbi:aminotransferase class V-fold PLP-dependent enzyme [Streptomyces sp. AM 4-1-1]|uniref:aminotransferase class V-fold PLP-dependent enzyme n=1 Tax=Streptomyces sp. AM 4-1-1 TaxID=3028710 RepID=UPI0023BA057F|nr:aminotransferase class V-fold PLP-dependent enzyme [Streptomyces sp. AM 4-1-1]WEH32808.1 aminotransferase class V-fold PLP-dependent enzyme [Streptomyces sp. AM 4-1-1]
METSSLIQVARAEFAPRNTYLNTATCGLLPRRAAEAVKALAEENAVGSTAGSGSFEAVDVVRTAFARLAGVGADRVAIGSSVTGHVGLIAASLPPGAEVLFPEGEFSSVVSSFASRGDLRTRYVPLEALAESVRPDTALVAFSAVQSADGRVADLAAVRAAAAVHGARTLLDATQSAGWLPLDAGAWDYTVTGGFKYLLCPRGVSFLTVTEDAQEALRPLAVGWVAADDRANSLYGPVGRLSTAARRYDDSPVFLAHYGAERSLALLAEVGVEAVYAHNTGLAERLRTGLAALGHKTVPEKSATVAAPGLGSREPELSRAGVLAADRAGNLRVSFHLYNTEADVDRVLDVLAG